LVASWWAVGWVTNWIRVPLAHRLDRRLFETTQLFVSKGFVRHAIKSVS
jgi:hypothetical protein